MKNSVIIFIITALIGLGVGYLVYDVILPSDSDQPQVATNNNKEQPKEADKVKQENTEGTTTVASDNILAEKGCLGCHAVSKLNLDGGATGPDLSQAYSNVEGKHGKPIDAFLKEPTSAVMSTVIAGNPLTDDEIGQIVTLLKEASEK